MRDADVSSGTVGGYPGLLTEFPRASDVASPEGATECLALIGMEYGERGRSSCYRGDQLAIVPAPMLTGSSIAGWHPMKNPSKAST